MSSVPRLQGIAVILLTSVFALDACTPKPTESSGRQVVEHLIAKQSSGTIRLDSFAKTNGQQTELLGVKVYLMYYQAEIEFNNDSWWGGMTGPSTTEPFAAIPYRPSSGAPYNVLDTLLKTKVRRGDKKTITGVLRFEQSERGWAAEDGLVY